MNPNPGSETCTVITFINVGPRQTVPVTVPAVTVPVTSPVTVPAVTVPVTAPVTVPAVTVPVNVLFAVLVTVPLTVPVTISDPLPESDEAVELPLLVTSELKVDVEFA